MLQISDSSHNDRKNLSFNSSISHHLIEIKLKEP